MPETVVHFQIRMPPVLHERLASWAMDKKISLNATVVAMLKGSLGTARGKGEPTVARVSRARPGQRGIPLPPFTIVGRLFGPKPGLV